MNVTNDNSNNLSYKDMCNSLHVFFSSVPFLYNRIFSHSTNCLTKFLLCFLFLPVDILDDMLAGVGMTMQDYLKHGENDYYPPLANGHRLFLHDIRRVAVRCAVAMGEEGDMVVSSWTLYY